MCIKKEKETIILEKLINVVVVDDNSAVTNNMKKYFLSSTNVKIVAIFNNGKDGLDYLLNNEKEYDAIILDIVLPQVDGIRILEELQMHNITKQIMILSSYKDEYTIQRVRQLGASFYMLKPFSMESLEKRLLDICYNTHIKPSYVSTSVEYEVSSILHELGIPSHLRGYQYIRDGILLMYENDMNTTLVTKDIYPELADKYDTTSSRVERAIRHAIEISWVRGDLKLMENLFGHSIDYEKSKPTNSEFLATIADRLKLNSKTLIS